MTGGGSGIGLACAVRPARDGWRVTVCGPTEKRLRDAAAWRETLELNAIRPGLVRTELVAGIADGGPVLDDYLDCMPLRRVGEPEDFAAAVRFLAGSESDWITGQVINVDGGHHLRRGPDFRSMFEPMFGADALDGRAFE